MLLESLSIANTLKALLMNIKLARDLIPSRDRIWIDDVRGKKTLALVTQVLTGGSHTCVNLSLTVMQTGLIVSMKVSKTATFEVVGAMSNVAVNSLTHGDGASWRISVNHGNVQNSNHCVGC